MGVLGDPPDPNGHFKRDWAALIARLNQEDGTLRRGRLEKQEVLREEWKRLHKPDAKESSFEKS